MAYIFMGAMRLDLETHHPPGGLVMSRPTGDHQGWFPRWPAALRGLWYSTAEAGDEVRAGPCGLLSFGSTSPVQACPTPPLGKDNELVNTDFLELDEKEYMKALFAAEAQDSVPPDSGPAGFQESTTLQTGTSCSSDLPPVHRAH